MITLALVLSLAAILRGIAWIVEGVHAWAHPEPPETDDDMAAEFNRYAAQRAREYRQENRAGLELATRIGDSRR